MPMKPAVARALGAAGVLAIASFVVIRSGEERTHSRSAGLPAASQAAPPSVMPAAAQPAPTAEPIADAPAPTREPQPIAEPAPTPQAAAQPDRSPLSPRDEMDIACRLAAGRLRPLGSLATDETNLRAAEVWGEIFAAAEKLNKLTDPSAPRPVECPEHLMRQYYERMRDEGQRARQLSQAQ